MNRLSSHRIVRACSEHRCKGFRRVSGVNLVFEGVLFRTAHGAGSESRRRSGGELEQRLRRGPRRGHRRQPYPLQIGPDRSRIGPGGDDSQAPATGRAFAEVGGKHPRQQGRPAQPMAAGRSARRAVRRRRLGNRLGRHDALAGPGPGRQDPVVAQEMKPGRGEPEPPAPAPRRRADRRRCRRAGRVWCPSG